MPNLHSNQAPAAPLLFTVAAFQIRIPPAHHFRSKRAYYYYHLKSFAKHDSIYETHSAPSGSVQNPDLRSGRGHRYRTLLEYSLKLSGA